MIKATRFISIYIDLYLRLITTANCKWDSSYDRALGAFKREKKTTLCNILYFYIIIYSIFLRENVSKAINGQLHRLAINSSVIVACFYLQNCTDSQPLGISLHKMDR